MNLDFASVWETIADIVPENDALICGDEVVSWKDYDLNSSKIATALLNAGLSANSKAGLYLNNSNEYLIAQNAIFKIGGVPINVNYRYMAEELIYLLDNSDSEAVFYHACYSGRIKEIANSLPNIKAWIEIPDGTKSEFHDSLVFTELLDSCEPMEEFIEIQIQSICYTPEVQQVCQKASCINKESFLFSYLEHSKQWDTMCLKTSITLKSKFIILKKIIHSLKV